MVTSLANRLGRDIKFDLLDDFFLAKCPECSSTSIPEIKEVTPQNVSTLQKSDSHCSIGKSFTQSGSILAVVFLLNGIVFLEYISLIFCRSKSICKLCILYLIDTRKCIRRFACVWISFVIIFPPPFPVLIKYSSLAHPLIHFLRINSILNNSYQFLWTTLLIDFVCVKHVMIMKRSVISDKRWFTMVQWNHWTKFEKKIFRLCSISVSQLSWLWRRVLSSYCVFWFGADCVNISSTTSSVNEYVITI